MSKPVVLAVDDDPEVLNAVERDLRQHFRADYRVVKARSGPQALDATRQLKQRGTDIALFLVDERMPEMTGTQFLIEALKLYPDARNHRFAAGPPTMFMCGNDDAAKGVVRGVLDQFGWETLDCGKAEAARPIEPLCMLWCIPGFIHNEWTHAFRVLHQEVA